MTGKKAKKNEDQKTKVIQIRLSESDHNALKQLAADKGVYIADLVRSLIENNKPG